MARYYRRKFRHRNFRHHQKFQRKYSALSILFYKTNKFVRRHPIFSAVSSIILSIVLVRISFSEKLFGNDISEFRLWFLFFAVLLGIIAIFALKVWYSNNVANFNVQANLNWKRR